MLEIPFSGMLPTYPYRITSFYQGNPKNHTLQCLHKMISVPCRFHQTFFPHGNRRVCEKVHLIRFYHFGLLLILIFYVFKHMEIA